MTSFANKCNKVRYRVARAAKNTKFVHFLIKDHMKPTRVTNLVCTKQTETNSDETEVTLLCLTLAHSSLLPQGKVVTI